MIAGPDIVSQNVSGFSPSDLDSDDFLPITGQVYPIAIAMTNGSGSDVGTIDTLTFSGTGMTMTFVGAITGPSTGSSLAKRRIELWHAVAGASPTSGHLTATPTGAVWYLGMEVWKHPGVSLVTPMRNLTTSYDEFANTGDATLSMSGFLDAGNWTLCVACGLAGDNSAETVTADAGFTEVDAEFTLAAATGANATFGFVYKAGNGSPGMTFGGGAQTWLILGVELVAGSAEDPPVVESIDPTHGSSEGGTPVTITGTGFVDGATVDIGGQPATDVVVVSDTEITCVTPAYVP